MIEKRYCPVCHEELLVQYVVPTKTFCIDESGNLSREDNNLTDLPYVEVICSSDAAHEIPETLGLDAWIQDAEELIKHHL